MPDLRYTILHAWGATFTDAEKRLREQVQRFIELGWRPQGSVSISVRRKGGQTIYEDSTDLAQAMVKGKSND